LDNIYINARFLTQNITGVQRYAVEISRRLTKTTSNIVFVTPTKIKNTTIAQELNVLKFGLFSGHFWEQVELPIFLRKKKNPCLISLANFAPYFYNNFIITIHDLSFIRHPEWFTKKYSLYYKYLIYHISKKARKIITVSKFSKKEIIELLHINEEKIEIIYNAVPYIFKKTKNINNLNRFGNYILAVSSFDPRKNFIGLIQAYNKLRLKDIKLVIVGSKHRIFSMQDLKENKKNIIFTGYVDDNELITLYQNALLFVYPSFYEGFGLPPLEAMAHGCPVVVSQTSSLPEICGDAAYYINPYDINDISHGIKEVLKDSILRNKLIKNGNKRVSLFNWENSAKKLIETISKL